ncbi:unnamed protein product, partial [Rotaria sp. Silwood2]
TSSNLPPISLSHYQNQPTLFQYTPSIYHHQGPSIPDKTDLEQLDYLDHVCQEKPVEHAGGYSN